MDPVMLQLGPLAIRWYGLLIALGVLLGGSWAVQEAKKRGLDEEALLDAAPWLMVGGLIGARLVYVLTSPSAFFGPGGSPLDAFKIWQGGISIHGGILGIVIGMWIYSRLRGLDMWAYLDVMTPVGAFGIIGGRIGNIMNGSDTTGRLTGWPVGVTWPEPGTDTLGVFGRVIFGDNLWAGYPGTCSLGSSVSVYRCADVGGEVLRGPVHLTQLYGALVGVILIPILIWAFRRSHTPGSVFWQFILWYSVLRSVIEEPFRDNPLYWNVYLSEGVNEPGVGLFTLTQLVSVVLILVAAYLLWTAGTGREAEKRGAEAHGD